MMSRGMKNLIGLTNNSAGITSTLEHLGINNHLEWSTENNKSSQASFTKLGYIYYLSVASFTRVGGLFSQPF